MVVLVGTFWMVGMKMCVWIETFEMVKSEIKIMCLWNKKNLKWLFTITEWQFTIVEWHVTLKNIWNGQNKQYFDYFSKWKWPIKEFLNGPYVF